MSIAEGAILAYSDAARLCKLIDANLTPETRAHYGDVFKMLSEVFQEKERLIFLNSYIFQVKQ